MAESADDQGQAPAEDPRIAELTEQVSALKTEAAKYRTARNDALKTAHAQAAVLAAHKIEHTPDASALEALKIEDGKVMGEYAYTPPSPVRQEAPAKEPVQSGLTMADVRNMTPAQINSDWAAVSKVLEASNGG